MRVGLVAVLLAACSSGGVISMQDEHVLVQGVGLTNTTCTTDICPHNENTDMITYQGAIYLVHRTARSQVLNHDCSLRISKSTDGGKTFTLLAIIPGPTAATYPDLGDRDLRDPSFHVVNGNLTIKALTRLEVTSTRDSDVDTVTISTTSTDGGVTWSAFQPIGDPMWSFWRVKENAGVYYSAAYEDGDLAVKLYSSVDGVNWTAGATIYDTAADTPLETELTFMPSGRLLALVRMDGTDAEYLGSAGRLRTAVCWATAPYDHFDCPQVLDGYRLDGPISFFHDGHLIVVARKHLIETRDRKRTAVYEIGGNLEGGPLTITEKLVLPSTGDTSYAGVADLDADHTLVTWYTSDLATDEPWARAILEASDIRQAILDFGSF